LFEYIVKKKIKEIKLDSNMEKLIEIIPTKFAAAERVSPNGIEYQLDLVEDYLSIKPILDDVDHMFLILNKQRQIVYSNKLFLKFIGSNEILSQRFGEALSCVHASEEIGGCGTGENCRECGAIIAQINSMKLGVDQQECRISAEKNKVYDLKIWAKSIKIQETKYILVSVTDISDEKRRKVLERLFFHDVLNTAGSLKNFIELMQDSTLEEIKEFSKIGLDIATSLIDELKSQRMLGLAEDSKLLLDVDEVYPNEVFEAVYNSYNEIANSEKKQIILPQIRLSESTIKTDKTLLKRVLGNLIKNALEASNEGNTVSLGIEEFDSTIVFSVSNETFMPRDIQLQIFQRSFSTKGKGRGVGTYSVKLLTENYLKGQVTFLSTPEFGTTFYITIPKEI
jgi:nitrogen-specific signal transduction histidine kinase